MAVLRQKLYTLEEFKDYIARPENADQLFELIDGEIVEKMPGRTNNSFLAMKLDRKVYPYCVERNIPCYTSGGDGAYDIQGNVVAPDFAFKTTPMSDEYPDPEPPLWAVEIISPTDKAPAIRKKRQVYIRAGILYWEMYPDSKSVDVYAPRQAMKTFEMDETLDGGAVLPDFRVAVKDLFGE